MHGANLSGANLTGAYIHHADLSYANLYNAYLTSADLTYADLEGACLENTIGFNQTDYWGTPILEGCADTWGNDECSYGDECFEAGAASGDLNLDGVNNVLDIVILVDNILNPG